MFNVRTRQRIKFWNLQIFILLCSEESKLQERVPEVSGAVCNVTCFGRSSGVFSAFYVGVNCSCWACFFRI